MATLANRQSIVVGVDGSETSREAARWAAALAEHLHAPIVIMHAVVEPVYAYGDAAMLAYAEIADELRRAAKDIVITAEDAVRLHYPALDISSEIVHGRPDLALIELSKSARFVVVGSRGNSPGSLALGSVTLHVANRAHCPVVVWRGMPDAPAPSNLPVAVGVDGSELSEKAVELAFEFASIFDVPLVAAHTWVRNPVGIDTKENERAVLAERMAGWCEKYPDVSVEQVVEESNAAALLLEVGHRAQLVVVGSHGRGRLAATLLGSTTQNLLHYIDCPLMICRAAD